MLDIGDGFSSLVCEAEKGKGESTVFLVGIHLYWFRSHLESAQAGAVRRSLHQLPDFYRSRPQLKAGSVIVNAADWTTVSLSSNYVR
jgi:hypothetical protein